MVNSFYIRAMNDENVVSVEASRLVWQAMRDAIKRDPTDFAPDYFFGYSHACMLTFVISHDEWEAVKRDMGDLRALKQIEEFAAKQTCGITGASPQIIEGN